MLRRLLIAIIVTLAWLPLPAQAAVTITFFSREMGERFPHAFVELGGTLDATGTPVEGTYGFTATNLSPAILFGSVDGAVEPVTDRRKSEAHFSVTLSDAEYGDVHAVIEDWRTRPGKSYNLNKRNCVHFIGALARAAGLTAVDDPELMKKPRSYLLNVLEMNPSLNASAPPLVASQR